jgi:hypothetical protein
VLDPLSDFSFGLSKSLCVFVNIEFRVVMIGQDMTKSISPVRRKATHAGMCIASYVISYILLVFPEAVEGEVDYSYYLGKDYEKTYKRPKGRVATYVVNHVSGMDVTVMGALLEGDCSALAGAFTKKLPVIGLIMTSSEGLYAPRAGSAEAKQQTVELIETR